MKWQALQQTLQQPYQQSRWLEVLRAVLPGTDIFGNPQPIAIDHQVARRVVQLGRVRLNGDRQLAVLEIEVGDRIDVVRNRVGLRNFVARFIDQERAHGVLAVFLSPEQDYRFTFAAKESAFTDDGTLATKETAPRRYTYVLGPNEPCRTPAERFAVLATKAQDATLDDVIEGTPRRHGFTARASQGRSKSICFSLVTSTPYFIRQPVARGTSARSSTAVPADHSPNVCQRQALWSKIQLSSTPTQCV
jgi:hypothetical protein